MKEIASKIAKLIDVKSIVTLSLTATFVALSIRGGVPTEFITIYMSIIGFYFGTQANKNQSGGEGK